MSADLDTPMTRAQFGDLVGVSRQAIDDLVRRGLLADGASGGEWLLAYCDHLREVAAGRGGSNALELAAERARLAREQADKIAMQNAVTRGELAPAYLLEQVLARAGARAGRLLETIPGLLRRRLPQLTADDIAAVAAVVAKARNIAGAMRLSDIDKDDDDDTPELDVEDAA
jgi:phage terminase Nu1 subunit (DNA packaging protein)